MNQFIPVEITDDKLSRGFYESKPFTQFEQEYRLAQTLAYETEMKIEREMDKLEAEIWDKIADILIDAGIKNVDGVTDLVMRVFRENK